MSRKTASFSQLLNYINKGRKENDGYYFTYNIYSHKAYYIIKEYQENYKSLKKRKNSNALYHEIISLKYQNNLTIEELRAILKDLTEQYIRARANNNLAYGVIHEQHNQIHCHLMISSNEIASTKNKRLSQAQFDSVKKRLEEYAYNKYPKLEREKEHKKARAKTRTIDNEVQLKKRTGKKSDREIMRERLQAIFAKSKTPHSFTNALQQEKIRVYQRGKTFGFLDETTGKKYRLKTLELEKEFVAMNDRFMAKTDDKTQEVNRQTKKVFDEKVMQTSQERKSKTGKEYIRDKIREVLENSKSYSEFLSNLEKENIQIYRAGDSFGFIDKMTGYKYRLETLNLENEFNDFAYGVNKKKSFSERMKNFGKRFLQEVINDAEHLLTGKKPEMEDEIWTQEKAGERFKDSKQNVYIKKGLEAKADEQKKFRERNEAKETQRTKNEKQNFRENYFPKS